MKIEFFCPLWGCENIPFDQFCCNVAEAGYAGAELSFPLNDETTRENNLQTLEKYNLKHIAQHWETTEPDIEKHMDQFHQQLDWIASTNPLFINSQTGRDWFSFEDNQRILAVAKQVAAESGIKIVHETHRGRFSFCAATTRAFLEADPELRITADFSHWCNVSESLLADQQPAVDLAIKRTDHIHTRAGHPQGPQVSDPRAPEWAEALNTHLAWWDAIVQQHEKKEGTLTMTTEFGPAPYMQQLPFTKQPIANQWEINIHMMNLLAHRYRDK